MTLQLFDKDRESALADATRHSGASLPTWWELNGDSVLYYGSVIALAALAAGLFFAIWHYRIKIAVRALRAKRRLHAAYRGFTGTVVHKANENNR